MGGAWRVSTTCRGAAAPLRPGGSSRPAAPRAETAAQWRAVPLGRLPGDVERVAVAVLDPARRRRPLRAVRRARRTRWWPPSRRSSRILYHLERVYGIERSNRFKRGLDPGRQRSPATSGAATCARCRTPTAGDARARSAASRCAASRWRRPRSAVVEPEPEIANLDGALARDSGAPGRARVGSVVVSALVQGFGGRCRPHGLTIRSGLLLGWRASCAAARRAPRPGNRSRRCGPARASPRCSRAVPLRGLLLRRPPAEARDRSPAGTLLGTAAGRDRRPPVHVFGQLACVLYVQTGGPAGGGGRRHRRARQALCASLERLVRADERLV
jgi:hypothetical protein